MSIIEFYFSSIHGLKQVRSTTLYLQISLLKWLIKFLITIIKKE